MMDSISFALPVMVDYVPVCDAAVIARLSARLHVLNKPTYIRRRSAVSCTSIGLVIIQTWRRSVQWRTWMYKQLKKKWLFWFPYGADPAAIFIFPRNRRTLFVFQIIDLRQRSFQPSVVDSRIFFPPNNMNVILFNPHNNRDWFIRFLPRLLISGGIVGDRIRFTTVACKKQ